MSPKAFDTRAALLRSGREEFLEHGFEGASLRTICANAHVTTGAFYANFRKKEDLFCALVEGDLAAYDDIYTGLMDRVTADITSDTDNEMAIMGYVMRHRELFRLLFDCSRGTRYEGFKETLLARFDEGYQRFFDAHAKHPVDHDVVRTIVRMKFAQYLEVIYGDYDNERVGYITQRLFRFTKAGFKAILNDEGPA